MSLDKAEATIELVEFARSEVARKYGPEGITPLGYHNAIHSQDVYDAALAIGKKMIELTGNHYIDLDLLAIAAAFHDIEQGLGSGANEEASAAIATSRMSMYDFSLPAAMMVDAMINSTKVFFRDGIMRQLVTDTPGHCMPQILADADLATVGATTVVYWSRAEGLMFEIAKTDEPTVEQRRAFLENQARLLENHKFYTEVATQLYQHQAENLDFTLQLLAEIG